MAYIYLDELKEILPEILDRWIDEDDESWEWIFQEIEQKCHVGKRKKDKKQKKYAERIDELTNKVNEVIPKIMGDFDSRINALSKKVDELNNRINKLSDRQGDLTSRINRMNQDINAAKTMAQTAKQRTEVDYSKYSGKSDGDIEYNKEKIHADVVQDIYNRMSGRGATFEELNAFRNLLQKYDALEKKEIPVVKKMCETCKYDDGTLNFDDYPCSECNLNNKWEAKDNG